MDTRAGQVCDRCRGKKIKCDGASPSCSACVKAGARCIVSADLRRKTKIRGFVDDKDERIAQLEREKQTNQQEKQTLIARLADAEAANLRLKEELLQGHQRRVVHRSMPAAIQTPGSDVSHTSHIDGSALVMKHMGRLVFDDSGDGKFAGSTSGAHFILSVETALRSRHADYIPLSEDCYRLFLLENRRTSSGSDQQLADFAIDRLFTEQFKYYQIVIDRFARTWQALCPLVAADSLCEEFHHIYKRWPVPNSSLTATERSTLGSVCAILATEFFFLENDEPDIVVYAQDLYGRMAMSVVAELFLVNTSASLHTIALYSFYLLITGQRLSLSNISGVMVRMAQSQGLHRHARRFKFTQSQIEMRKRLWWYIYMFDKITAMHFGLPKLISDADVDNDLPQDCILDSTASEEIEAPLPGESTPVTAFIELVKLSRILNEALDQLYTTTKRRQGVEKTAALKRSLALWHSARDPFTRRGLFEIEAGDPTLPRCIMSIYLDIIPDVVEIIINRPALTFDKTSAAFQDALLTCREASRRIVDKLMTSTSSQMWLNAVPMGPSLLLHCALHEIFFQTSGIPVGTNTSLNEGTVAVVESSIALLQQYKPDATMPRVPRSCNPAIEQTMGGLQRIKALFQSNTQLLRTSSALTKNNTIAGEDILVGDPAEDTVMVSDLTFPMLESDFTGLDDFNWIFDLPEGTQDFTF